ncbi:MAG: CPBP family intramembrane metalloprotease [Candidatus Thorarchaeota archaeon]|nr:MAG: CPBP family intramembrane metalloprotease [Candidatus Thorarchaeota archaeon]
MSVDREAAVVRVVLFALTMLLIVELPHLGALPFRGTPTYNVVGSLLSLLSFPLMYLAVVVFLRMEGKNQIGELGIGVDDQTIFPHITVGAIAAIIAVGLVYVVAASFGGDVRDLASLTSDEVVSVVLIGIPVAFLEELSYRGYLMTRMESLWGQTRGILFSSLFFSLVHFNWWSPLGSVSVHLIVLFSMNMFLGGVVLGLGYYLSGRKLWVPIAYHFAWNVMAYSLFPVFPTDPVTHPELFQIEWGLTSLIGFLFGLSIIRMALSYFREKKKR